MMRLHRIPDRIYPSMHRIGKITSGYPPIFQGLLSTCEICSGSIESSSIRFADIEKGFSNGCRLCTVLCCGIAAFRKTLDPPQLLGTLDTIGLLKTQTGFEVELKHSSEDFPGDLVIPLQVFFDASSENASEAVPLHLLPQDVPSQLSLDRIVALIRKWITSCDWYHPRCTLSNHSRLPRRVLDISSRESESIKLLELSGVQAPYVCLSYCWGSSDTQLKTTSDTLPIHLRGIPWKFFPRTFQDVVCICRALKIRYLWIDALCIIQDSVEDWEIESARMADIYANSYLTIAASSGANTHASLLSDRWTSFSLPDGNIFRTQTSSFPIELERCTLRIRPKLHLAHRRFRELDNAHNHIADAPLLARAWAYQERLLPSRTLHIHAEELVWECKTGIRCECGFLDDSSLRFAESEGLFDFEDSPDFNWLKSLFADVDQTETSREKLTSIWMDLISEYTRLDLSYEKDRLPALSGLAAKFVHGLGDYRAGMWMKTLPLGLLWESCWNGNDFSQTPKYHPQAPSWSWASIPLAGRNGISYDRSYGCKICPDFSVLSVTGKVLGKNPFGWVKNAMLSVRGKSLRCFAVKKPDGSFGLKRRASHMTLSQHEDLMELSLDGPFNVEHNSRLWFLYIGSGLGLALQKASKSRQDPLIFQRVGLAVFDTDLDWEEHMTVKDLDLV